MKLSLDEYQEQNILDSFDAFNIICKNIFGVKNDKKNTFCTIILLLSLQSIFIFVLFPLAIKKGIILFNTIIFFQLFTPLITLIMTLMTEPGVLIKDKKFKEDQQSQLVASQPTKESNVTTINIDENVDQPRIYKERYCEFCCIMTPPKAAHCRVCNHCVDGFDHHCFWIGNCIGIRNWRMFVIFLTCAAISLFLCFTFGIVLFFYQYSITIQIWGEMFGSLGITVFAFYCLYFITGLWKITEILNIMFLISMILGPLLYSISLINNNPNYQNYQYFENPFLIIFVSLIFFVQFMIMFPYVLTNWHNVIYFKTAKQIKSEETFYLQKNLEYKMEQIYWIQIKQNINKFLTYKIPQTRFYII